MSKEATAPSAMKLALEALEDVQYYGSDQTKNDYDARIAAITALREALTSVPDWASEAKEQPAQQEPKQSEIFCGVDFADGLLSVSVLRRRADNVAEVLHAEQIELPAQQEPVAHRDDFWCADLTCKKCYSADFRFKHKNSVVNESLTTPAQRTWVGLTDEEIYSVLENLQVMHHRPPTTDSRVIFARAIEAKLRSKNEDRN